MGTFSGHLVLTCVVFCLASGGLVSSTGCDGHHKTVGMCDTACPCGCYWLEDACVTCQQRDIRIPQCEEWLHNQPRLNTPPVATEIRPNHTPETRIPQYKFPSPGQITSTQTGHTDTQTENQAATNISHTTTLLGGILVALNRAISRWQ